MELDWDKIRIALDIMWKGMLGIFVVIVLVMLCTLIIGKVGNYIEDRKNKAAEADNGSN
jgi:hypothetical protein